MIRTIEPNTEPFGSVIAMPLSWATKPVQQFNPQIKRYVVVAEMLDKTRYINVNFTPIEVGLCRICSQKVEPYATKYYQRHYDCGDKYSILYDAENYYCEECAKREASKEFVLGAPRVVQRIQTVRDGEPLERKIYSDGSEIEEMTAKERQKIGVEL